MFTKSKLLTCLAAVSISMVHEASSCVAESNENSAQRNKERVGAADSKSEMIYADKRPRIGLALGGGGARGAAEIGVLKVFQEEKIPIDCIAGTSIGSVIGGLYAAGLPLSQIQKMAENKSILKAFNSVPIPVRIALMPFTLAPRLVGIHHYVGLYSGKHFAAFLDNSLPDGRKKIEETLIPFRAVATDMLSGQPYVLNKGSLSQALTASAAIPGLRKPVIINGHRLCDGFLGGENLPIKETRAMGADVVICVNIDGPLRDAPDSKLHHVKSFENRTLNILLAKLDASAIKEADLTLCPDVADCAILSSRRSDMEKAIAAGEKAAREAIPQIRRLTRLDNERTAHSNNAGSL